MTAWQKDHETNAAICKEQTHIIRATYKSVFVTVSSPLVTLMGFFSLGHMKFFFFFHSCLFVVLLVGWFVCFVWQQDYTEKTILRISPRFWWRICLNPETDQIKVWCGLRWRGGSWIFFSLTSPLQYITILLIPQSIILDLDEIKSGVIRWLVPVSEYILMWIRI